MRGRWLERLRRRAHIVEKRGGEFRRRIDFSGRTVAASAVMVF
jgi:hypothetical protein